MRDSRSHRLGTGTRYLNLYLGIHCAAIAFATGCSGMIILPCSSPELNPSYCQVLRVGSLDSASLVFSVLFIVLSPSA